jgi:hypothetical protein
MEWFAVGGAVNVLRRVLQKIKGWAGRRGLRPSRFRDFFRLRDQNDHANATLPRNRQRLIQPQLMLCIHNSRRFNRIHDEHNVADPGQKTTFLFPRPARKTWRLGKEQENRQRRFSCFKGQRFQGNSWAIGRRLVAALKSQCNVARPFYVGFGNLPSSSHFLNCLTGTQ